MVTILILIDGFLQYHNDNFLEKLLLVTILILIDGFLQYLKDFNLKNDEIGHNPYFNRWFSAIICQIIKVEKVVGVTILILIDGFLQ